MNTTIVLCLIALALSLDYSIGLITLQAYWKHLNGMDSLFGVIFGMYDGFVIFITPIIAWLLNKSYVKYKTIFIMGLVLNLVGNIIYSFAFTMNTWVFILLGRAISGVGASVLPLLVIYIAMTMNIEQQRSAVGYVKYTAAMTRVIGPIVGIGLSMMDTTNKYANQYTILGWIPAGICTIVIIVVAFWQEEEQMPSLLETEHDIDYSTIIKMFLPIASLGFITTFIYWYFMGNGFVIATYRFHIIHNVHELGKLYYSGLGSFIIAFILFIFFQEYISGNIGLWMSSILLIVTSTFFLCNLHFMFHVAVGATTFCYAVLIPSINIQNNLLAKKHKEMLGNYVGVSIVALSVFQSVARFVGPACFMLFKSLTENAECNINDPNHYNTTGCNVTGYIPSSTVSIVMSFVVTIICLYFTRKVQNMTFNTSIQ